MLAILTLGLWPNHLNLSPHLICLSDSVSPAIHFGVNCYIFNKGIQKRLRSLFYTDLHAAGKEGKRGRGEKVKRGRGEEGKSGRSEEVKR